MKRAAVIIAVLVIAAAGVLWLWKSLDAPPRVTDESAQSAKDQHSRADAPSPSTTPLAADSKEGADDSKDGSPGLQREELTARAAAAEDIALHVSLKDAADMKTNLPGASVKFVHGTQQIVFKTDEKGQYEIKSLRAGRWKISIELDAYKPWSKELTFTNDPRVQEFTLGLERLNVVWVILRTPKGENLFDVIKRDPALQNRIAVMLVATSAAPGEKLVPGLDGLRRTRYGDVQTEGTPPPGVIATADRYFELSKPLPMYVSACVADAVLDTQYVLGGQQSVTLSIDPEALRRQLHLVRVRVLDADTEAPLTGALVSLGAVSSGGRVVDAAGFAYFENQIPGSKSLSIRAPNHEMWNDVVRVESKGDTDAGPYRLGAAVAIEGKCVFDNAAAANVALDIVMLDAENHAKPAAFQQFHGEAPGSFTVQGLGRHKYLLRVNDPHWSAKPIVVDTSNRTKSDITIHCLATASVVLYVDPDAVDEVDILDADQVPIEERPVPPDAKLELHLMPGAYTAVLMKSGQKVSTEHFQAGGTVQEINFRHP